VICFEIDPSYFHTGVKASESQSDLSGFNTYIFQMFLQ